MFGDDDDTEESATGATRYPVMPSLVALQQMRSRLHMAQLGRKLMKWTSVATASELRRISADLHSVYNTFAEDLKEAYILLARCRYFFPDFNKMVINDVQKLASVTVSSNTKTVSGVRLIQYRIMETDTPYDYLGLGAGGEAIEEAKKAWSKLLRLHILMVELRRSFMIVEIVHKTATKRLNVINKIVIPRTKASIKYIQLELEEIEREELHRIKVVQACKKIRKQDRKREPQKEHVERQMCVLCEELEPEPLPTPSILPPPKIPIPPPIPLPPPRTQTLLRTPSPLPKIYEPSIDKPSEMIAVHEPIIEPQKEIYKPICCKDKPCSVTRAVSPISHISLGDNGGVSKLEHLKEMLDTTISLGQDVAKTDDGTSKMDEVINLCKEAKLKLDKEPKSGTKLEKDLEHLKLHIRQVIDITRGLRDVTCFSPSVENFIQACKTVDEKFKVAMRNVETKDLDAKNHFIDLKDEINDVLKVIAAYKKEGILMRSVENFERVCKETRSKIDCYTEEAVPSIKEQKLEHLKSHIDTLESLTADVKQDGVRSASIERFLESCKYFKQKLQQYKIRDKQVSKLILQIDEAIKSTQVAKQEGLVSSSVDRFIKSCENFKTRLGTKNNENQKPLHKMKSDIEDVMDLISNLRMQGLITESTAQFLRMCEDTKNKLDLDIMFPTSALCESILSPECGELCTCQSDQAQELCDRCKDMYEPEKNKSVAIDEPPPCNTCRGLMEEVKEVPRSACNAVHPLNSEGSRGKEFISEFLSAQKLELPCSSCKAILLEPACPIKPVENADDGEKVGVFEKKIKTITKITRYRTETGDIREEKEVTTIQNVKHDPHDTNIEVEYEDVESDESFEVGLCIAPTQNQVGFRNKVEKSKSEQVMRATSLNHPHFRQCVSFNPQVCLVGTSSLTLLDNYSEQVSSTTSLCIFHSTFE